MKNSWAMISITSLPRIQIRDICMCISHSILSQKQTAINSGHPKETGKNGSSLLQTGSAKNMDCLRSQKIWINGKIPQNDRRGTNYGEWKHTKNGGRGFYSWSDILRDDIDEAIPAHGKL